MNVDLGIWAKLTRVTIFLLTVAAIMAVGVWYFPLIRQNEAMRKEILNLDSQIKLQEEKIRIEEQAIRAMRNDPKTVERLARQKLGYAKPGETVFLFEEPVTNRVGFKPLN